MNILFKTLGCIFFLVILALIYYHIYIPRKTINFYKKQGVSILPGASRPLLGNVLEFVKYAKASNASDEPLHPGLTWLTEKLPNDKDGMQMEGHKAIIFSLFSSPNILI